MILIKGDIEWYEPYGNVTDLKSYFGLATSFLAVQMVFPVLLIFVLI
jgi:hypothetical protein